MANKMTVGKLIEELSKFKKNVNVDVSDRKGTFYGISGVGSEVWTDDDEVRHESVTLFIWKYNNENSVVPE